MIGRTLQLSRLSAWRQSRERPHFHRRAEDPQGLERVREVTRRRDRDGHRRVCARLNRLFKTWCNRERTRRLMRRHGLQLPPTVRRRTGRAHVGTIETERPDMRGCSDVRGCRDVLEIGGWNGETVQVGVALDCCDGEALPDVAAARDRTGEDLRLLMSRAIRHRVPEAGRTAGPLQWLSDNGAISTALETPLLAGRLGLVPVTTPARSPPSNGMSEAFVNPLRRDYVEGAELWSAETVLAQGEGWIRGYNEEPPHSALGMKSPREFRAEAALAASP